MKKLFKRFGIVAATAIAGFLVAGCDNNTNAAPTIRTIPGPGIGFGPGPGSQPASEFDGTWDRDGSDGLILNRGNWVQWWWWNGNEAGGAKGTYTISGNQISIVQTGIFMNLAMAREYGIDAGWYDRSGMREVLRKVYPGVNPEPWLDETFITTTATFGANGDTLIRTWPTGSTTVYQRRL